MYSCTCLRDMATANMKGPARTLSFFRTNALPRANNSGIKSISLLFSTDPVYVYSPCGFWFLSRLASLGLPRAHLYGRQDRFSKKTGSRNGDEGRNNSKERACLPKD